MTADDTNHFLTPTQWKLLRQFQEKKHKVAPAVAIPRQPRTTNVFPLSFAQERLWFLEQLIPGNIFYNVPLLIQLHGIVHVDALEQSLSTMLQRHEILRTHFTAHAGKPLQVVNISANLRFSIIEIEDAPDEKQQQALRWLSQEEAQQPFDLGKAPLMRALLIRCHPRKHILLLTFHHIVTDGWTVSLFFDELFALYADFAAQRTPSLLDLPLQYVDFAAWQRQQSQEELFNQQLTYWQQQLADLPTHPLLPYDYPKPARSLSPANVCTLRIDNSMANHLEAITQTEGLTLLTLYIALFATLLYRITRQDDIVLGMPTAGRDVRETEYILGFFVNMLILRLTIKDHMTFHAVLQHIRAVMAEAYTYQNLPFEKLVEALQPERDPYQHPLLRAVVSFQYALKDYSSALDLGVSVQQIDSGVAQFDIEVTFAVEATGHTCQFKYNTDLYAEETIQRLLESFEYLLQGISAHPEQPIGALPLLSSAQVAQQLLTWNPPSQPSPEQDLAHLFEQQVRFHPDALALVCDQEQMSYLALDQRANQLAHWLQRQGVRAEVPVGICLERSNTLIWTLLALLKAGGAYVPLDSSYPVERLQWMIEDAQLSIVLTQRSALPPGLQARTQSLVYLEDLTQELRGLPVEAPLRNSDPANLAYIIYTSGSTGQPKGVAVTHQAICRLVLQTNYIAITDQDRIAQISNISFDGATFEIWGALLSGAQLVSLRKDLVLSFQDFAQALLAYSISIAFLTTALFNEITRHYPTIFNTLRYLLFGGEAADIQRIRAFMLAGTPQHLLHVYGPTENTTFSTWYPIADTIHTTPIVSLGSPINSTQLYLLDTRLQVVPIGCSGELYLGGNGLARGYFHQPALTARSFVPHPFSQTPGARLYKTGDLARFRADGTLEFLGRADQQIKLRGFRIELREIEVALEKHPSVQQALVRVFQTSNAEKFLVAYLLTPPSLTPALSELRTYLQRHLPDYMLPSAFVLLERFPLNANGKVNHAALPEPSFSLHDQERKGTRPRSPQEELVLEVWREVLQRADIGVHDQFFSLGGHSLLATQVISRLRRITGVEMPLRILFEAPTVAQQAHWLETRGEHLDRTTRPPLQPQPHGAFLPLSFAQQRIWFLHQMQPDSPLYNLFVVYRFSDKLDFPRLVRCLNEIVQRHESLRTIFPDAAHGQPEQHIIPELLLQPMYIDLSIYTAANQQAELLMQAVNEDIQRPFYLDQGPLLRATVIKMADKEHFLLMCMHHCISDGWSMQVFQREFSALYAADLAGEASPLPPLPIQYRDYTLWQRQWLQGEVLEKQLAYWRVQLADLPRLELPVDFPRPALESFSGSYCTLALSLELTTKLKTLSQQQGVTLFMTVLAAFQTLLFRYSGQQDIAIGSPIANRTHDETDQLIGFFVNILVLRIQMYSNFSFIQLLEKVRNITIEAYAHQDAPLEYLIETLHPERSLSHSSLFSAVFVLQQEMQLDKMMLLQPVHFIQMKTKTSKFDLSLQVNDLAEGLWCLFEYNSDIFQTQTIELMSNHFQRLLESIVTDPHKRLSMLSLLSDDESEQLDEWSMSSS